MSQSIEHNIANVRQRILDAEKKYGRIADSVQLMAVSKTQPAISIRQAVAAGIVHLGENYLQEALEKIEALADLGICWHFIGPIQSNKTRAIAEHFSWAHSVDRLKIAQRLNDQRPPHLPPLNLCLQVNIDSEASKSGITLDQLPELCQQIGKLPNIRLRGLMAIPKASDNEDDQRIAFAKLAKAMHQLNDQTTGAPSLDTLNTFDTLSIGMSKDLEAAIAEGSTLVRIGTDIFGPRRT